MTVWLLLLAVAGCAGYLIGDVTCARRNHVGPWSDDSPLDRMGRAINTSNTRRG